MSELVTVQPSELKFLFETNRQACSTLKVVNETGRLVAFKVKTTSPKMYYVRPNAGFIGPHGYVEIVVTMQSRAESPPNFQCKDRFLVQSVVVPDGSTSIGPELFAKDAGRHVQEKKLRVVFLSPQDFSVKFMSELRQKIQEVNATLSTLSEERNAAVLHSQRLQQELRRMSVARSFEPKQVGFSFLVVLLVGLLGLFFGYILAS